MKNIYIFLFILLFIGCESIPLKKTKTIDLKCPTLLFSKQHKIYFGSLEKDFSLDNITYKAEINNAVINNCELNGNIFNANLSILFDVKPLEAEKELIKFPFYLAVIDENENLENILYFSVEDYLKKDEESELFIETEIIISKKINFEFKSSIEDTSKFIVGFILDNERKKLLN